MKQAIEIRAENGNYAGYLKGNIFYKRVSEARHKFRKIGENGSWGIDYHILFNVLQKSTVVRIYDTEHDVTYQAPIQKYKENGEILHFNDGTKDHSTQVFLPIEYFDKTSI